MENVEPLQIRNNIKLPENHYNFFCFYFCLTILFFQHLNLNNIYKTIVYKYTRILEF